MRARQEGFTLLELIVVLIVLALVAGLVGTRFVASRGNDFLESTAHQFASRCRAVRAAAIRGGRQHVLLIDLADRRVVADVDFRPLAIPASITIHAETSARERRSPSIAGIRFYPNGGSSGGALTLEADHRSYAVRVNWFTGRVIVERLL